MTRAIGDTELQLNRIVDLRKFEKKNYYVITLASDGLYDALDSETFF